MIRFFERLFFDPKWYHYIVALLLLPLSLIYALIPLARRLFSKAKDYGLPIVSIGNIIVGGSGKTPFAIALIKHLEAQGYSDIFYISRGYGRHSKGLVVVKKDNKILCSVDKSGDEAMLVASSTNCSVIVAEDRVKAIKRAKEFGAKIVILDDAFSKVAIKKYDILLEPQEIKNYLPLPSGPFREFYFVKKYAQLTLKEGRDFKRVVSFRDLTKRMLLVSAIANPQRLQPFLPKGVVGSLLLKDHAYFNKNEIIDKMDQFQATSLLVTQKDYVKLKDYNLPLSIMDLHLEIDSKVIKKIEDYIGAYR